MAGVGEIIAGIASGGASLLRTGYDMWTNQRDFDYQKSLQNEIFNREDNAVQRRMKDLEAAGLNPNLAAGSAAGAGAVVGRSNTPSLSGGSVGAALDAASHVQQLRAQKIQNQILKNQEQKSLFDAKIAKSNAEYNNLQNTFDELALMYQLGLTSDTKLIIRDDGTFGIKRNHSEGPGEYLINNTPLQNQLQWQWQNNKNSAYLLQKDADWYDTQQVLNAIGGAARATAGFGSGYYNFNRR